MGKLTQDEKLKIRDEAVAEWWKDWFAADYSWDGLTKYPWQGWKVVESKTAYQKYLDKHGLPAGCPNEACQVVPADFDGLPKRTKTRSATLQDYWRDQEDKLEGQEGGKLYTIAHLPPKYEDGSKSWKSHSKSQNWIKLLNLLEYLERTSVRTDADSNPRSSSIAGRDGRINLDGCVIASFPKNRWRGDKFEIEKVESDKCISAPDVLHVKMHHTAVLYRQDFRQVTFSSRSDFRRTLFLGTHTTFRSAIFSGGIADFRGAHFASESTNFIDTEFLFGSANFAAAKFLGRSISFRGAKFSDGSALFSNSLFSGGSVIFRHTQFTKGRAYFKGARFIGGRTSFSYAKFLDGDAVFSDAIFSGGDVFFTEARFKNGFKFSNAQFNHRSVFKNAVFSDASGTQDSFNGAQFLGPVDFSRTIFGDDNGILSTALHFPFNAFAHANFKDQLILTQQGDDYAQAEFDRAVEAIQVACADEDEDQQERRWVALESGCRTLKRAMEDISDKNRSQRYFKFELLARQRRPKTSRVTKLMTSLYGLTADYGGSIGRPLLALFIAWAIFTLGYLWNAWAVEVETAKPWQMLWGAMDFSATHIFRPLFIWSKSAATGDGSWIAQYHDQLSAGGWLTIKIFATIQSFLSITLLFLFGLATKRKFQMS